MNWFTTLARFLTVTTKRLYDLIASYLLFWVLYFASVAVVLHVGIDMAANALGVEPMTWWTALADIIATSPDTARLLAVVVLHGFVLIPVFRPITEIQPLFEAAFGKMAGIFDRVTTDRLKLRLFGEAIFSMVVTAFLVPFALQPTLVPEVTTSESWVERGANLVDGTASLHLMESVIGLYRLGFVDAVVADRGVTAEELEQSDREDAEYVFHEPSGAIDWMVYGPMPPGTEPVELEEAETPLESAPKPPQPRRPNPVMDRWDPTILAAVDNDHEQFAYVKAFMYVESAGRQYAVSRTGCAGLMQFCSGTARSHPFKRVFGTGQVYTCQCRRGCSIDRSVRAALESGERGQVEAQADEFPCQLTDARFDPDKAVRAGALYVGGLHEDYGGNIQIMYIGYNSGPAVARRVWRGVGANPDASLSEIEEVLPGALEPYYGKSAHVRARSLVQVHLPKIERAYERYAPEPPPVVELAATQK